MASTTVVRDRFLSWIADNGFTLTQPFEWTGSRVGYPATCPEGHDCAPVPSRAYQGRGVCAPCGIASRNRAKSEAARDRFLSWITDNGFTLTQPFTWNGSGAACPATCPEGHDCAPRPNDVQQGQGGCHRCGGSHGQRAKSEAARDRFLSWIADNGFTLTQPFEWTGSRVGYPATCPEGHDCAPHPDGAVQGESGCAVCGWARRNVAKSEAARDRFLSWITDNGFTLTQPFTWNGSGAACPATCPEGHDCAPIPNSVQQGKGGCTTCAGKVWDAFYVVRNVDAATVKFGVTSGDPRPRLRDHARNGFTEVLRTFGELPEGEAANLERELMTLMRCADVQPVQGREYFPDATLNVLLPTVDAWFA